MNDLEDALRASLHGRLDAVEADPGTAAGTPLRARAVRRRRVMTAVVGSATGLAVLAGTVVAVDTWRADRATIRPVTDPPAESSLPADRARHYAEQFAAGDFSSIRADMTDRTRSALAVPALRGVWREAFPAGTSVETAGSRESVSGGSAVGAVELRSAATTATFRVMFDDDRRVTGVLLTSDRTQGRTPEVTRTVAIAEQLARGDLAAVRADFDDTMRNGLPEDRLRLAWQQVVAEYGEFRGTDGVIARVSGRHLVVDAVCEFADGTMKLRVSYDEARRVAGLFVLPLDG